MRIAAQYWGESGAGILAIAKDTGRILVALRSDQVMEPGTWSTIGGKLDEDDSFEDAALREFQEETGYSGPIELISAYKFTDEPVFEYQNFIGLVPHEIENLSANWETDEFQWITLDELKSLGPKHPGLEMLVENSMGLLEELAQGAQMELPFEHLKAAIRLIAAEEILYHVTFIENISEIAQQGLTPSYGGTFSGYGWQSKRSHLTEESGIDYWINRIGNIGEQYSDNPIEDGLIPIVLRIHGLDPNELAIDERGTEDAIAEAYYYTETIPPEDIEVWDGSWKSIKEIDLDNLREAAYNAAEYERYVEDGEEVELVWPDMEVFKPE